MPTRDATATVERELEQHRPELTGYCYRMLASPFEAEDAVQETLLRAWRAKDQFERRATLRTWLYRIATNVCIDMAEQRDRRAMPIDLGPASEPVPENLATPEIPWVEPMPDARLVSGGAAGDPAVDAIRHESVRLAFVTALQRLPARQRAVLLLREVLQLSAAETASSLEMSEASVNSALQRARATLDDNRTALDRATVPTSGIDRALLDRFVDAFERYDMAALETALREDALQSMPPFDLWLEGRDDVLAWFFGPGIACRGSRLIPAGTANGSPAFGQYKPGETPGVLEPWALVIPELKPDGVAALTFFLETERLFPLFELPATVPAVA